MPAELLQYNIDYDRHETDTEFIMTQLETHLKERFNVLLSTVEYEIVDGHLVRPGKTEPFINSIRRGRDLLRKLSTSPIDFDREDAEVMGFGEKIDPVLSDSTSPINTKFLSASLNGNMDRKGNPIPEGESKYGHNFYDIFTLKKRENGKRYVELTRYGSGLAAKDYASILPGFDPENPPTPAEFLGNPIMIPDTQITADQIHQALHREHEYMGASEFNDGIWETLKDSDVVRNYILKRDGRSFNAILNLADEIWENKKRRDAGKEFRDYISQPPSHFERRRFEEQEVRQVPTACPGKSGADINKSLWSVSDLEKNRGYSFDHEGTCAVCNSGPKSLGPCEICEDCTIEIEREEEMLAIAA